MIIVEVSPDHRGITGDRNRHAEPVIRHRVARRELGLLGQHGVDGDRVDGRPVVNLDGEPAARNSHPGRQVPALGVPGHKTAVAKHGFPAGVLKQDCVPVLAGTRRKRAGETELDQKRVIALLARRRGNGEALLQTAAVVYVPLDKIAPPVHHAVAVSDPFGLLHRAHRSLVAKALERHTPLPARLLLAEPGHPDRVLVEESPQMVLGIAGRKGRPLSLLDHTVSILFDQVLNLRPLSRGQALRRAGVRLQDAPGRKTGHCRPDLRGGHSHDPGSRHFHQAKQDCQDHYSPEPAPPAPALSFLFLHTSSLHYQVPPFLLLAAPLSRLPIQRPSV